MQILLSGNGIQCINKATGTVAVANETTVDITASFSRSQPIFIVAVAVAVAVAVFFSPVFAVFAVFGNFGVFWLLF